MKTLPILGAALAASISTSSAAITVSGTESFRSNSLNFAAPAQFSTSASLANLTTLGTTDWAYYTVSAGAVAELNSKSGGSGLGLPTFLNVNRTGGLNDGSNGGGGNTHFQYSDGTSPTSSADQTGVGARADRGGSQTFNNDPGPSFTLSAPVGNDTNTLYLWFSGFKVSNAASAFNIAAFDGASQVGTTINVAGATNGNDSGLALIYKIEYGGGTTTSGNLDFRVRFTGGLQDNSKLALNGAALSVIPEPSSLALLGLGLLGLVVRRRR